MKNKKGFAPYRETSNLNKTFCLLNKAMVYSQSKTSSTINSHSMKFKDQQVRFVNNEKSLFFPTLRERVDAYFKENNISRHANAEMVVKTATLTIGYLLPFVLLLVFQPPLWLALIHWAIMGVALSGIGMSVMHDANHGAYSTNKTVNYLMGHSLNLLGGSVFNWKLQHNVLHHTYTNIIPLDEDIKDRLVLRFSPHSKVRAFHRLQYVYAFLFYGILTLYWALLKDFIQFAQFTKSGVNKNTKLQNLSTLLRIVGVKVVYFSAFFVFPVFYLGISFSYILIGFLLMHFISGLILTVVFQLAHTVEGTTHPLADENGNIENSFAIHQMNTTVNFSRDSKILSWYLGGLNYQVEHHLFPHICHIHYPQLAPIVKKTAEEFGVPYLENKTFGQALRSHISLLQRLGKLPDINEAIG